MLKILESSDEIIKKNIEILAKDYFEKTGRKVCRTCPSDLAYMIASLKNIYKMTNFSFKKHAAQYKNAKGDKTTISNNTMTDKKAIEFLKTNPKRIELFAKFPSNWKKLISGEIETAEQLEARLAIEAELAIANKAKNEASENNSNEEETEEERQSRINAEAEAAAIAAASGEPSQEEKMKGQIEQKREELMKMSLSDLRSKFPNVKATSIKVFVERVLKL